MKKCHMCGNVYSSTSRRCAPCNNEYNKNKGYSLKRKFDESAMSRLRAQLKERRELVQREKSKPCTDCGVQYPYWIMQFDHVRGKKQFNVCAGVYKASTERILKEIEKCDVVCANCHAERTHRRRVSVAGTPLVRSGVS